jgi:hypothetical protein
MLFLYIFTPDFIGIRSEEAKESNFLKTQNRGT